MNLSPFTHAQPERRTLIQRLLRRRPARNALVDLVRVFDESDSPQAVTSVDIDRITIEYGINVIATFRPDLERMYREYLSFCLMDRRLSDDEVADLEHLRLLFGLDAATCDAIHRNVTRQIYMRSVTEVLADGTIDEHEREFLRSLQQNLGIPEAVAENIVEVRQRQYRSRSRDRLDRR